MRWVYLSPHFDDVVLSCGGLVWEQVQARQPIQVWTICAGAPPAGSPLSPFAHELHERWGTGIEAVPARMEEDEKAIRLLGAVVRYWDLPDCIYRRLPSRAASSEIRWLVNGEDDLWQPVNPQEAGVIERMVEWLAQGLQPEDILVSPLTLGNHVDHRLVRAAAEKAAEGQGCALLYYPDYPYAVRPGVVWTGKIGENWWKTCRGISDVALKAWQDAVACYSSQLSTFFSGRAALDAALADYLALGGGACLYQPEEYRNVKFG